MSMMTIKEMLKTQGEVMDIIKHCVSLEEDNASLRREMINMTDANRELRRILESYKKEAKEKCEECRYFYMKISENPCPSCCVGKHSNFVAKEDDNEDVSNKVVDHSNVNDTNSGT